MAQLGEFVVSVRRARKRVELLCRLPWARRFVERHPQPFQRWIANGVDVVRDVAT